MKTRIQFGNVAAEIILPDGTEILRMPEHEAATAPDALIRRALRHPIGTPSLPEIVRRKGKDAGNVKTVIVVSDNTRPVPYKGPSGILWPIIDTLKMAGIPASNITLLVATGTHAPMPDKALRQMLDKRIFDAGIAVRNHDCTDDANLVDLGNSSRGNRVLVNRTYMEASLRILTGLVESHFMAGASGGRKAICPGLIGEHSTYVFHGAALLSHPDARDLVLTGNPVHEEALEIALMAGADFTVNVTLNRRYEVTGVFAGALEDAHRQAVATLRKHVEIPIRRKYDIVVTHGGYVGVNHYQCAKAAVTAIPALHHDSVLFMLANTTDPEPVGSKRYRSMLSLLKTTGAACFMRRLLDEDWNFIPEQWQAQMWAKVFQVIPPDNFYFFSPYLDNDGTALLPGHNAARLVAGLPAATAPQKLMRTVTAEGLPRLAGRFRAAHGRAPRIVFLADGPYGILKRLQE